MSAFKVGNVVTYIVGNMKGVVRQIAHREDIGEIVLVRWDDGHESWMSTKVLLSFNDHKRIWGKP